MTRQSRVTVSWTALIAGALVLVLAAAGVTCWLAAGHGRVAHDAAAHDSARHSSKPAGDHQPQPVDAAGRSASVTVTLTGEAARRAGIRLAPATTGEVREQIRIPAVVEANAYKQVAVTPLVTGRVTRVAVELGDRVRRGQSLAEIYSPELADAQREYLSFTGEFEAAHQALRRTERLVEIGAASRQELERTRAEHIAHETHLEGARSRLVLLGMTPEELDRLKPGRPISAVTTVVSPLAGVILEREANPGLNVDASMKLFTVADLSTVWVVGDVYERDLARVRVGSPATIRTDAYPGLSLQGRVSYIDPRVSPETRTARVRVEVPNPDMQLRLGMYVDLLVDSGAPARAVLVPKSAVQTIGTRTVVYVASAGESGRFTEREVRLGAAAGDRVQILSGLEAGESVVVEGSFHLRAERERLGLGPRDGSTATTVSAGQSHAAGSVQTARIVISARGYEPSTLTLRAGIPARITFVRTTDATCGTEVVLPSHGIKRALPLNEPVDIEFTPRAAGEITFSCGMGMLRGTILPQ
ncbi:MAG TPA: efflux RND transporter periplasmic adaptor subunit [Vicinamibacterales bacterium]|nr:efflux RND transporter periplasmic adaptor subunit [Vicinamibacterales bacterium]